MALHDLSQTSAGARAGAAATSQPVRVLGLLDGNIYDRSSTAHVKYAQLFAALAKQTHVVDVHDVALQGAARYQNALRTMHWSQRRWRERFYKNVWAFEQRTNRARSIARMCQNDADVIFQHGTVFSANGGPGSPPVVVYTDYTFRLAQREDVWRNPFTNAAESERWNALEREAAQKAAFVLTRSEYTRRSMIEDYEIAPERVAAVGGGINFEHLPEPTALANVPRILFIGKDFVRKGGGEIVAAFAQVRDRVPEAELWLVTANDQLSGPGIRRIAPTNDRAVIAQLYREASIFAMPSRAETWGDVFLEAMAYGLPCVGTTSNAMPEIIDHGVTGFVVPPDDISSLAAHLEKLLTDASLRERMGAAGRARVESRFTWDQVVRRMLPYLERARLERRNSFS